MKKKERFETLKKLLEIEESPWHGARPLRVIAKKTPQSASCHKKRASAQDTSHQVNVPSSVIQRAEAIQENLDARFPSFVKPMIRSNVNKGFWLSLPKLFCHLHLPSHDTTIILEDEHLRKYSTRYLAERRGLSAGWMGFSIAHNLMEGDALVFHLVRPNKLKVYIIRSGVLDEVDAALCLMDLEADAKQMGSGHRKIDCSVLKNLRSVPQMSVDVKEDKPKPYNQSVEEMDHSEKLGKDLQVALNGLKSKTCSIADALETRNDSPSNDVASIWKKQRVDYEQMLGDLSEIDGQLKQLLCLVLEPKPFYCKSFRGAVYMRNQDRGTAEVNLLVLKENVDSLYSKIEVLKRNSDMCDLKL